MRSLTLVAAAAIAAAVFVVAARRPQAQSFSAPAGSVEAPNPEVPLYFEAASLKPSDPKAGPGMGIRRQPGGRFNTFNTTVRVLITFAYQIQDYQLVEAPDWIKNARYDIVAKMEGDPPPVMPGTGPDPHMVAMRTLLAERFKLVIHRETRELDIYALVIARPDGKPAPALKPTTQDCEAMLEQARRGTLPPPPGPNSPVVCACRKSTPGTEGRPEAKAWARPSGSMPVTCSRTRSFAAQRDSLTARSPPPEPISSRVVADSAESRGRISRRYSRCHPDRAPLTSPNCR